ncbi:MAG: toll/interleukin-1 receptor domain-containing protein [Saprospiraceae bacterium]
MNKEKIIRDEATYFCNRFLKYTTTTRAIEQFKLLKERLKDFYSPEFKAIFLDHIENLINEKSELNKNLIDQKDAANLKDKYFEKLLFYLNQELNTLPALARQNFSNSSNQVRDKVFVSCSPMDKEYLDEIRKHFKPFDGRINFWDKDKILPGQDWKDEIQTAISQTKVIILLLSADFLASDFIISDELPSLLKASENDGAVILSVILKPCLYEVVEELNHYQTMNRANIPVLKMDEIEREELYVNLVRQTKRILNGK